MTDEDKIGPTGQFPGGKIDPDDQGELAIGLAIDEVRELIIIEFGAHVAWLGLTPQQAIALAADLKDKANKLLADPNILLEDSNGT